MNLVIFLVAGGFAFFAGVGLLLIATALGCSSQAWVRSLASLCGVLGIIAVIVSATPLPAWFHILAGCVTFAWLIAVHKKSTPLQRRRLASVVLAGVWLGAAVMELPYQFLPAVQPTNTTAFTLLADSVSAGISDREHGTWPKLIQQKRAVTIHDYSQMGATVASALKTAKRVRIEDDIVVLEIGGNDLLGSTSVADFKRDLDLLLSHLARPKRQIIMFELPLPPFCNGFGRAQRVLAARYHVQLIPRRIFLEVLTANDATLDSIHLSKQGHQRMAERVWQILEPAFISRSHDE